MPAFAVEFMTGEGPRRGQFTLDPERELGPQVRQVLEELRQHGTVIAGGPGDELAVLWNGRDLDLGATPAALGVSPQRALEIRMRPAPRAAPAPGPAVSPVRIRRFTRGAYACILTGMAGGLLGWGACAWVRDLGPLLSDYPRLDLFTATVLGLCVGAAVLAGAARRRQERAFAAALLGLLLGAAGGAGGAALGRGAQAFVADGAEGFRAGRVAAWTVLGCVLALALALRERRGGPGVVAEAAGWGTGGGLLAGLAFSLSGPGDFWQALAFAVLGAAVGAGMGLPAVRRAAGVIEVETVAGREPGLLGHREWALAEGARIRVRGAGPGRTNALVALADGRCWVGPAGQGETVVVSGRPLADPAELRDGDRIDLGAARFRFRRLARAAAMTRRAVLLCAAGLLAAGGPAGAQDTVRLVRCGPDGRAACLRVETTLAPARAGAMAQAESAGVWRLSVDGAAREARPSDVPREARPPLRLLVLVDVSGSMSDGGLQTTRSALRAFLSELPDASVRAAVVPFASARVAERIRAARFVPGSHAAAQVDALPAPDGNTALYSAVRAGLDRLGAEPAPGDTAWNALLVITDGRNDVDHAGDDPGLLKEAAGRRSAVEAIRASGAHAWIVGLGAGLDADELRALAAPRGAPFLVAEDPVALRRALEHIRGWIFTGREFLLPVAGSAQAALAAGPARVTASAGATRAGGAWVPPTFALPAFQGRSAAPVEGAAGDPWRLRRAAVLAVFGGALLVLWTAVPPLLRVHVPVPHAPAPRALAAGTPGRRRVRLRTPDGVLPVAGAAALAAAAADGLRPGLTEAPPRRPTDVTAKVSRPVQRT